MGPPRSGSGRGTSLEVVVEEDPLRSGGGRGLPLEVVVEEDPPRSGGGRGPPRSGSGRGPPPPKDKDQTRPAEKSCWASGWYALEKKLTCTNIRISSIN